MFPKGAALRDAEKQINEQNQKFRNGESTFYEKLNKDSDLTKEQFEREKEGAKFPVTTEGRGLGAILPPESEWYTSPELEELYMSPQNVPNSFDATAKGISKFNNTILAVLIITIYYCLILQN
jgi:hypothetical protein